MTLHLAVNHTLGLLGDGAGQIPKLGVQVHITLRLSCVYSGDAVSSTHLGGDLGDEEGRVPVGHGGVQAVAHVHGDIDQLICSGITSVSVIMMV